MRKWFKDSLTFSCTACGKCCKSKGSTKVYLNLAETQAIAEHIGLDVPTFNVRYTDDRLDSENRPLKSIKQHETKQQCTFLEGSKCSVYEVRPAQCRTYPFWPQNMIGPAEWIAESHLCEGIKVTKPLSLVAARLSLPISSPLSKVQRGGGDDVVALNMLTHEIHDRGRGENWTYQETIDLLNMTKEENPALLDEYLESFFDSNESRIEYESPFLRVVDTRFANQDTDTDSKPKSESIYSRRMEFVSSPQLAQTEISFTVGTEEWQRSALRTSTSASATEKTISPTFDHRSLHMAVHRTLGGLAEKLLRLRAHSSTRSAVAVIGAGCCALPANLLCTFPSSLSVHAVEPAQEVLDIADSHFGMAQFPADRLVRHAVDGAAFIRRFPTSRYDVIIIDAFESAPSEELAKIADLARGAAGVDSAYFEEEDGDGLPAVLAPPLSLLDHWQQWAHALRPSPSDPSGAPGGLLAVNAYGPVAWIEHVRAGIEQSGLYCPVRWTDTASAAELQSLGPMDSRNVVLSSMLRQDAEYFEKYLK